MVKEFSYNVNAMLEIVASPDDSTVNYDYDVLDELIGRVKIMSKTRRLFTAMTVTAHQTTNAALLPMQADYKIE